MKAHKTRKKKLQQGLKRQHFYRERQREQGQASFSPEIMTKTHQLLTALCKLLGKSQAKVIEDAVRHFKGQHLKPAQIVPSKGVVSVKRIYVWICPNAAADIQKLTYSDTEGGTEKGIAFRDKSSATDALIEAYHDYHVWK